jgi:hypothetical protein
MVFPELTPLVLLVPSLSEFLLGTLVKAEKTDSLVTLVAKIREQLTKRESDVTLAARFPYRESRSFFPSGD